MPLGFRCPASQVFPAFHTLKVYICHLYRPSRASQVIDDPDNDKIYMVLEYEEKGPVFEGTGPEGGVGEERARVYTRDVVAGLQYLHYHNIVHGDIKPDNLLVSRDWR